MVQLNVILIIATSLMSLSLRLMQWAAQDVQQMECLPSKKEPENNNINWEFIQHIV